MRGTKKLFGSRFLAFPTRWRHRRPANCDWTVCHVPLRLSGKELALHMLLSTSHVPQTKEYRLSHCRDFVAGKSKLMMSLCISKAEHPAVSLIYKRLIRASQHQPTFKGD